MKSLVEMLQMLLATATPTATRALCFCCRRAAAAASNKSQATGDGWDGDSLADSFMHVINRRGIANVVHGNRVESFFFSSSLFLRE